MLITSTHGLHDYTMVRIRLWSPRHAATNDRRSALVAEEVLPYSNETVLSTWKRWAAKFDEPLFTFDDERGFQCVALPL